MATTAAAYKPQAKTVDIQRINPDAVAEYHFPVHNDFTPFVLPNIIDSSTVLIQGAHSSFSIEDSLPLSASIYEYQMESDPATADFMEVDGDGGDLSTNVKR